MARVETIAEMVIAMKSVYPHYLKNADVKATATSWALLFSDTPDEVFRSAFVRCLKRCTFPPTPADVEGEIKRNSMNSVDVSTEWAQLISICRTVNELRDDFAYDYIPDGSTTTQGQDARRQAREVFDGLPNCLRQYLGSYSGMLQFAQEIGAQNDTGIAIRRREYEQWRAKNVDGMTSGELMLEGDLIPQLDKKFLKS